jgi:hypothetical protein
MGLSENMESEFDIEAAAGEADSARKDKRRWAVTRPAESHVDSGRLRFSIIVIVCRHANEQRAAIKKWQPLVENI